MPALAEDLTAGVRSSVKGNIEMDKHAVASLGKRNWVWSMLTAALAVLLTASTAAQAEVIYLKCPPEMVEPYIVDLTNHTVNGVPAVITPITIDWDINNSVGNAHYHIDRAAGTETASGIFHLEDGDEPAPRSTYPCASVSAPATKF